MVIQPWWLGGRVADNVHTSLCSTSVDQIPSSMILGPILCAIFISPLFDVENLTCFEQQYLTFENLNTFDYSKYLLLLAKVFSLTS